MKLFSRQGSPAKAAVIVVALLVFGYVMDGIQIRDTHELRTSIREGMTAEGIQVVVTVEHAGSYQEALFAASAAVIALYPDDTIACLTTEADCVPSATGALEIRFLIT